MRFDPVVLAYHKIEGGFELGANRLSPRRFERHLRTLRASDHTSVSLSALIAIARGEVPPSERVVHLTFDDGYASFARTWALCRRYGFAATVFPLTGYLGRMNVWDCVVPRTRHLDKGELRELVADGAEIGAHTVTHPFLTCTTASAASEEIRASKRALEDALGTAVRAFAYPYGDWSPRLAELVAEAGYELAFTLDPLRRWETANRFALPRTAIYGFDSVTTLRAKLGVYGETTRRAAGRFNRFVNRCAYANRLLPRRANRAINGTPSQESSNL
jgi:peptidoglycan/xylan/chitin deacetylase (PgdA/CDA1 family)